MMRPTRSHHGLSRRALLTGLGVSAALAPFLPILNASGQGAVGPKRLLLIYSPDGSRAGISWKPQGTETSFTLDPIHAPLDPIKSKLVIPWGIKMSARGAGEQHAYGMAGLWCGAVLPGPQPGADFDGGNGHRTGWGSGPSVDQVVAMASGPNCPYNRAPTDPNQETPYRTLELGVQCNNPDSVHRMIYKGAGQPIHPETNPQNLFTRLFSKPLGLDPMAVARMQAENASVLDIVKGDIARLRGRISAEDYPKVDAHLSGIRALEQRLATMPPPASACSTPMAPQASNGAFPMEVASMLDLAAHALACDRHVS